VAAARAAALCGWLPREGADCIQVPRRGGRIPIVTAGFVRAAHRAGLPVHVWTVNAESSMHELLELGVDGIMTDHPRLLRDVFAARGLAVAAQRTRRRTLYASGPPTSALTNSRAASSSRRRVRLFPTRS
jgi:glycerophosphoryl diester phosphodiesterase